MLRELESLRNFGALRGYALLHPLVYWGVSALAMYIISFIVPGFKIRNDGSALLASLAIGMANFLVRPALIFLTFPVSLMTLGLITFLFDGVILKICSLFLKHFEIESWFAALLGTVIVAVLGTAVQVLL